MPAFPSHFELCWHSRQGRVLIVGDIHGEIGLFRRLLTLANYNERKDFIFALGDLIDRGPYSRDVLDWFANPKGRKALLGNHEALMLEAEAYAGVDRAWIYNGGEWGRDLGPVNAYLYRCMLRQNPLSAEIQYDTGLRVGLVHAEVRVGLSWAQLKKTAPTLGDALNDRLPTNSASAIWGRTRFTADCLLRETPMSDMRADRKASVWKAIQPVKGVDLLIAGHSRVEDHVPRGRGNLLWIDTGSGYKGGWLTAVDPLAGIYWQVGPNDADSRGPLPLPAPEPVLSSWRPSRRELKEAKALELAAEEKRRNVDRMLGFR